MPRPDDLQNFTSPPLVEVAVSVQFSTPSGYSDIYAREIWALFESNFTLVQEQPLLEPMFEVFGPQGQASFHIGFGQPMGNRYWFSRPDQSELIQFQRDRFIHNWRKVPGINNEYPRFESIIEKFSSDLGKLDTYFNDKGWGQFAPNQCELIYVNQMSLTDEQGELLNKSFYFNKLDVSLIGDVDGFNINLRQIIAGEDGRPVGRLYIEANTVTDGAGKPLLNLNMTVRGAPTNTTHEAAIKFLNDARIKIVNTFTEFTSESAHKKWGRTQ